MNWNWNLLFFTIFSISCTKCGVVSSTLGNEEFAENYLQSLTRPEIAARAHSAVVLMDGSRVVAGTLTSPNTLPFIPRFTNEQDLVRFPNMTHPTQTTAFVMRVSDNDTSPVKWAKRTTYTGESTKWSVAFDGQDIFLSGHATEFPKGLGTDSCCVLSAGMIAMKYSVDGVRKNVSIIGNGTDAYTSIMTSSKNNGSLVLTGIVSRNSSLFEGKTIEKPNQDLKFATGRSLVVMKFDKTLHLKGWNPVSFGPSDVEVRQDVYWGSALSTDETKLFIGHRREFSVRGVMSFVVNLLSVDMKGLRLAGQVLLPRDLQTTMKLASNPLKSGGFFLSYISRTLNKENVVIRHMADNLRSLVLPNTEGGVFRRRIEHDATHAREPVSSVRDLVVDRDGHLHLLLYTSEIVNRSIAKYEEHRALTKRRVALMVVGRDMKVAHVAQAQVENVWEPAQLTMDREEYVVVGTERLVTPVVQERIFLVDTPRVEIRVMPSSAPTPMPVESGKAKPSTGAKATPKASVGARPPTPRATVTPSPGGVRSGNGACVGKSSRVNGRSIGEIIGSHRGLRMQHHPLRWLKSGGFEKRVEMVCLEKEDRKNRFCATENHIVRYEGVAMFMRDACRRLGCRKQMDLAMNFKGECGNDVKINSKLDVTMHSGEYDFVSAEETVKEECGMRENMRLLWLVRTL